MRQSSPLGEIVHFYRLDRGRSLGQLAADSGLHKSTLSRIEAGKLQKPSVRVLRQLAVGLHLSMEVLLNPPAPARDTELPPLEPYLRDRYGLPEQAIAVVGAVLVQYGVPVRDLAPRIVDLEKR